MTDPLREHIRAQMLAAGAIEEVEEEPPPPVVRPFTGWTLAAAQALTQEQLESLEEDETRDIAAEAWANEEAAAAGAQEGAQIQGIMDQIYFASRAELHALNAAFIDPAWQDGTAALRRVAGEEMPLDPATARPLPISRPSIFDTSPEVRAEAMERFMSRYGTEGTAERAELAREREDKL